MGQPNQKRTRFTVGVISLFAVTSLGASSGASLGIASTAAAEETKPAHAASTTTHNSGASLKAVSKDYHLSMQFWQDQSLITAPKFNIPENEPIELTVTDPDDVKISITLRPQNTSNNEILVDSNISLSQGGRWETVGSPRLATHTGQHATVEIDVQELGFTHNDGRPVSTLRFSVLIKETK